MWQALLPGMLLTMFESLVVSDWNLKPCHGELIDLFTGYCVCTESLPCNPQLAA